MPGFNYSDPDDHGPECLDPNQTCWKCRAEAVDDDNEFIPYLDPPTPPPRKRSAAMMTQKHVENAEFLQKDLAGQMIAIKKHFEQSENRRQELGRIIETFCNRSQRDGSSTNAAKKGGYARSQSKELEAVLKQVEEKYSHVSDIINWLREKTKGLEQENLALKQRKMEHQEERACHFEESSHLTEENKNLRKQAEQKLNQLAIQLNQKIEEQTSREAEIKRLETFSKHQEEEIQKCGTVKAELTSKVHEFTKLAQEHNKKGDELKIQEKISAGLKLELEQYKVELEARVRECDRLEVVREQEREQTMMETRKLSKLEHEHEELSRMLTERDEQNEALVQECKEIQIEFKNTDWTNNYLSEKMLRQASIIDDREEQIEELKEEMSNLNVKLDDQNAELAQKDKEMHSKEQQLVELRSVNRTIASEKLRLEREVKDHQQRFTDLKKGFENMFK